MASGRIVGAAPAVRRRLAGFPWHSTIKTDIPWGSRTYTFSWVDGGLTVKDHDWAIQRDAHNRVVGIVGTEPGYDVNKLGFPELDYKQAKAMEDMSAKTGCSLKVAFGKVYPMDDLPRSVLEKIALAPEQFAPASTEEAVAEDKKKTMEKYLADTGIQL